MSGGRNRVPPSGTVTFFFTDLERSTRIWEEHEDDMAGALARHDQLLEEAIGSHRGYVFSTAGDSFAAAFDSAADAVDAAVEGQRALRKEQWAGSVLLRVRMGIHSGAAHERGDNYFGPVVNRAARLLSVAHGGQVLASAATVALLPHDHSFALVDLGRHRLPDLLAPEHLYHVDVDGDGELFPPPNSLDAVEHNLPVLRSTYFPNDRDLHRVGSLLNTSGLVTLTGFGGVGKTRLALEIAVRSIDEYDGVHFVDLAPILDGQLVVQTTATSLGISVGDSPADMSTIVRSLQTRKTLLIFDNCEHLLDAVAELVTTLATHCRMCAIMATSREPLGVDGELVWRVQSMDLAAARALFEDRARAARPDIAVGTSERRAIDEICTRLDRIPLALELAASRVTHLSISEIAALLDQRFHLLSGPRHRTRTRQQTLQATMDWSYGLLQPEEQVVLRCCAVFVGGFTLEALGSVTGDQGDNTLDRLGSLVAKSLVVADTRDDASSRYGLLETVREYVLDRLLDEGESRLLRQRHARWFSQNVREVAPGMARADADRLEVERANFLAALDWLEEVHDLVQLGRVVARLVISLPSYTWVDQSNKYLGRDDIDAALEGDDRAAYALACSVNANAMGDFTTQYSEAVRAHELAGRGSAVRLLAASSVAGALAALDPQAGFAIVDEAIAEITVATEPTRPLLLAARADCLFTSGRLEEGVRLTYELCDLRARRGLPWVGRGNFALILHVLGRNDEARQALDFVSLERDFDAYQQRLGHALLAAVDGDHAEARAQLLQAAQAARSTSARLLDRDLLIAAAALAFRRGNAHRASVLLGVERERLITRSPGTWALYTHYRDKAREALPREEIDACKIEARDLTIDQALAQELNGAWEPTGSIVADDL